MLSWDDYEEELAPGPVLTAAVLDGGRGVGQMTGGQMTGGQMTSGQAAPTALPLTGVAVPVEIPVPLPDITPMAALNPPSAAVVAEPAPAAETSAPLASSGTAA
ncbi:MAG: hypothetical protein ACKOZX_09400, partial [Gammaproteobacteria bacterium]